MDFSHSLATLALHAGTAPDPVTGAILTPIYQSTTFVQEGVGRHKGFTYSRSGNPTVAALERRLAALEGAEHCLCFGTGLAATTALALSELRAGDRAILSDVLYGGTVRLFQQVLCRFGVTAELVDTSDLGALEAALRIPARLLFLETPANPTLKLTDIAGAVRLARSAEAAGTLVVVDNTLLTPVFQRPLDLGADLVLHSTTKFIDGHNATVGGALLAFEVEGGVDAAVRVMESVRLCALAENLGAAETLITHPASMTHAALTPEQRRAAGITDGLIRLSVGLEDPAGIIDDLCRALAA